MSFVALWFVMRCCASCIFVLLYYCVDEPACAAACQAQVPVSAVKSRTAGRRKDPNPPVNAGIVLGKWRSDLFLEERGASNWLSLPFIPPARR